MSLVFFKICKRCPTWRESGTLQTCCPQWSAIRISLRPDNPHWDGTPSIRYLRIHWAALWVQPCEPLPVRNTSTMYLCNQFLSVLNFVSTTPFNGEVYTRYNSTFDCEIFNFFDQVGGILSQGILDSLLFIANGHNITEILLIVSGVKT